MIALSWRGWAMGAGALILGTAGRVLGLIELFVLAAACVALLVAGVVSVSFSTVGLEAARRVSPPRVHAGTDARVELTARNTGRHTTPVVALRDTLQGDGRRARFLVAPLRAGQEDRASYRLTLELRGRYLLGPLELRRTDPFGLVSRVRVTAPVSELIVYPAVDVIAPLGSTDGDRASGTHLPAGVATSGDDFYGLREYQVGDDLRRVHWPSTARLDELTIRQAELPGQGEAAVLLDTRGRVHDQESMDLAVSAAASVVVACWRQGCAVRLVTTEGFDSGFGQGPGHLETLLGHLAVVQPGPAGGAGATGAHPGVGAPGTLASTVRRLQTSARRGTTLAAVTTTGSSADDLTLVASLHRGQDRVALIIVDRADGVEKAAVLPPALGGAVVARVSGPRSLPAAWTQALARNRSGPAVSATGSWGPPAPGGRRR